jgi:succinyl-diaminopimelate desuccinylase
MTDLLALTAELVDIPSVSHNEAAITDHVARVLQPATWLEVTRVGHTLVARTDLGRPQRLVLGGHVDTVPPNGNERARVEGDVLWGLGSADMKAGVAVLLELALSVPSPAVDVTYVFYECEEVQSYFNGVERLFDERPDLLQGDAAVLAEPTGGAVEAGCQGTMYLDVAMTGTRAHAARGWKGRNAIHRLGPVLDVLSAYEGRRVVIDGCEYREGLQAVGVTGGIATNVVPDSAVLTLNHRFAPDRTPAEAAEHVRSVVGPVVDRFEVLDSSPGAPPSLDHPLLSALLGLTGQAPRAKLGWTDVARFATRGIPATNFGPGDPGLAHMAEERVTRSEIHHAFHVLRSLLQGTHVPGQSS